MRILIAGIAALALLETPARAADAVNWSGAYVGFNAGIDVGQNGITDGLNYESPAVRALMNIESYNHVTVGGIFGAQLGYNWQFAPTLVVGIEADWDYDNSENLPACVATCLSTPASLPFANYAISLTDRERLRWFGTVRPRIGFLTGDTLWFVTGGAAWSGVKVALAQSVIVGGGPSPLVNSQTAYTADHTTIGFTAGGGVEARLSSNWTAKAEYIYLDLGSINDGFNVSEAGNTSGIAGAILATTTNSHLHDHIFRVGLNYRFWSWAP